ncbi:unnamed protein product [Prorocentrum cordatum]|uniref:Uncharacterized protein n=1 Tax=Prorocentrum cordatum TaxID=2364126 RepID=A0ABN9WCP7_9DINO|nr:unnamed protein product [Polarella glacialis]
MVEKAKTAPLIDFKTEDTQCYDKADEPCVLTTSEYSEHDTSATIEDDDHETAASPLRKADPIGVLTASEYDSSTTTERKEVDMVERNTLQYDGSATADFETLPKVRGDNLLASSLAGSVFEEHANMDGKKAPSKGASKTCHSNGSYTSYSKRMAGFEPLQQGKAKGKGFRSVFP